MCCGSGDTVLAVLTQPVIYLHVPMLTCANIHTVNSQNTISVAVQTEKHSV